MALGWRAEWMGASLTATTLATHSSAPALAAMDAVSWHAALRQYGAEWVEDLIDAATSATVDGMLPLVRGFKFETPVGVQEGGQRGQNSAYSQRRELSA